MLVLGKVEVDGFVVCAGLMSGDRVLEVNGEVIREFLDLVARVCAHLGEIISVRVHRIDGEHSLLVMVVVEEVEG